VLDAEGRQLSTPDLVADAVVKRFADHVGRGYPVILGRARQLLFDSGSLGLGKTTLLRKIAGFIEPDGGEHRHRRQEHARCAAESPPREHVFSSWPCSR